MMRGRLTMSTESVVNSFPSLEGGEGIVESMKQLRYRAAKCEQRIILTDGEDPRILAAVRNLQYFSNLQFVLVGDTSAIFSQAKCLGIAGRIEIYDPLCNPLQRQLTQLL